MELEEFAATKDSSLDGNVRSRHALCNVTNSLIRKEFLSTKKEPDPENASFCWKIGDTKPADEDFRIQSVGIGSVIEEKENAMQIFLSFENLPDKDCQSLSLLKRKCQFMNSDDDGDGPSKDAAALNASEGPLEERELAFPSSSKDLLGGVAAKAEIIGGDVPGGSFLPSHCHELIDTSLKREGYSHDCYVKIDADVLQNTIEVDEVEAPMVSQEKVGSGKCVANASQFPAANVSNMQFVGSQESMTDGVEIPSQASLDKSVSASCIGESACLRPKVGVLKESANAHAGYIVDSGFIPHDCLDSDKNCSCPFCLKAAYLWSDLQYQDARDRLAALKKTRKQVKQLVASYNDNDKENHAHNGLDNSPKMEHNLLQKWQSLFLHTEDVLVYEISQLQSNILKLKELKENCERDLQGG